MKRLGPIRFFIVLLAIGAMLGIATASSSPDHFHAKPPANGCDICFAAAFASLGAKTLAALTHAPLLQGHITLCSAISGYRLFRSKAALTRGPPSSFSLS